MADKGIIFSAPMVRALLAGTKTQTRRLLRHPEFYGCPTGDCPHERQAECNAAMAALSAKEANGYAPGDRLYVRETWSCHWATDDQKPRDIDPNLWSVRYLADDTILPARKDGSLATADQCKKQRPGRHMPRWASRLWLDVTEVRVQRLQDISEADALAEGVAREWVIVGANCNGGRHGEDWDWRHWHKAGNEPDEGFESAVDAYAALWSTLHTEPGQRWEDNPWIVAVSFTVHKGNVEEVAK